MIFSLFKSRQRSQIPNQLYGILVASARAPELYSDYQVEDTVMGRFEMLSLHIYLFSRRLKREGSRQADELSQDVFDLFTDGVEIALRELGIGDTTVPKRKKKMIHSFYGQIEDFDKPLDDDDAKALCAAVLSRIYSGEEAKSAGAESLTAHIRSLESALEATSINDLYGGSLELPAPKGAK